MDPIAGAAVSFLLVYTNGNLKTKAGEGGGRGGKKILHGDFVNTMQPPGAQKISVILISFAGSRQC